MAIPMAADRAEHFWLRRFGAGASAFRRTLVGVAAGTAIACWLAVLPAMAQQPDGDALSRKGAGENATPPSLDLSDRKQLLIVGSSTMDAITDAVIERLNRD